MQTRLDEIKTAMKKRGGVHDIEAFNDLVKLTNVLEKFPEAQPKLDTAYYIFELNNIIFNFEKCVEDIAKITEEKEINSIKCRMQEIAEEYRTKIKQASNSSSYRTALALNPKLFEDFFHIMSETLTSMTNKELIEYSKRLIKHDYHNSDSPNNNKPKEAYAIAIRTDGQEVTVGIILFKIKLH